MPHSNCKCYVNPFDIFCFKGQNQALWRCLTSDFMGMGRRGRYRISERGSPGNC